MNRSKALPGIGYREECSLARPFEGAGADLQPSDPQGMADSKSVIVELRRFQKRQHFSGLSVKEMIEEGRH
jgi:hypothetical protein